MIGTDIPVVDARTTDVMRDIARSDHERTVRISVVVHAKFRLVRRQNADFENSNLFIGLVYVY